MARTARAIRRRQALDAPFELPRPRTERGLVVAGRVFLVNAAPVAATFVRYGLPPDFLDQVRASLAAVEREVTAFAGARSTVSTSAHRIAASLREASLAVQDLDAVVANVLAGDREAIQRWRFARRLAVDAPPPTALRQPDLSASRALATVPTTGELVTDEPASLDVESRERVDGKGAGPAPAIEQELDVWLLLRVTLRGPFRYDGLPALRRARGPLLLGPGEGLGVALEDAGQHDGTVVGDVELNPVGGEAGGAADFLPVPLNGPDRRGAVLHEAILSRPRADRRSAPSVQIGRAHV